MRDTLPGRASGKQPGQAARDVFVRQAVESIAAHAFRIEMLRDGVVVRQRVVTAVEGGVEAGDLRKVSARARMERIGAGCWAGGGASEHSAEPGEHLVDHHRRSGRTAVHDRCPTAIGSSSARHAASARHGERGRHVGHALGRISPSIKGVPSAAVGAAAAHRCRPSALDQPFEPARRIGADTWNLTLEAGVDDGDRIHRGSRHRQRGRAADARHSTAAARDAARRTDRPRGRGPSARAPRTRPAPSAGHERGFWPGMPDSRSGTTRICAAQRPPT